jgi:hypothetical protein
MVREVRVNVFVDAHACGVDSAAVAFTDPAEDAVHRDRWLSVSEVPPFVHGPTDAEADFEPPDAEAIVACFRDVSPAAALLAPAAPGSPV